MCDPVQLEASRFLQTLLSAGVGVVIGVGSTLLTNHLTRRREMSEPVGLYMFAKGRELDPLLEKIGEDLEPYRRHTPHPPRNLGRTRKVWLSEIEVVGRDKEYNHAKTGLSQSDKRLIFETRHGLKIVFWTLEAIDDQIPTDGETEDHIKERKEIADQLAEVLACFHQSWRSIDGKVRRHYLRTARKSVRFVLNHQMIKSSKYGFLKYKRFMHQRLHEDQSMHDIRNYGDDP